jgi:potassium-dependent mechanosensitive channel
MSARQIILFSVIFLMLFCEQATGDYGNGKSPPDAQAPSVEIVDDMAVYMKNEAAQVKKDLKHQANTLIKHTPLGWDVNTLDYAFEQAVMLPARFPQLAAHIFEQSRILGVAGSAIMFVFFMAIGYSLIGRKRVLVKSEALAKPLIEKLPEEIRPYFYLALVSITAALIPLILLVLFSLVKGVIDFEAPWFILIGKMLGLWSIGALLMSLISGIVDRGILEIRTEYAGVAVRLIRAVILYILVGIAVLWSAGALDLPKDFLALLQFVVFLSIVTVLFLVFLRKKIILSLLPQLPYLSYQGFLKGLERYYYPVILMTFLSGVLWCIGYKDFTRTLWIKTWAVAGVYIGFSLIYHMLMIRFQKWSDGIELSDEKTHTLIRSIRVLTFYITIIMAILVMLNLLGVMEPIRKIMSFPIMSVGGSFLSLWVLLQAALMLAGFYYAAQLLCAYLDYKVYPSIGVAPGLAYAIDTFLKYFMLFLGAMISLQIVGFDLRSLMVFAGAIGIGIGLAMQSIASSLISGFVIIFGGKIRKGDWLEVSGTVGEVTDIYLRETNIKTRDNIEYLIPNSALISNTIINYTLSSPIIRIRVPFGVSYAADPHEVSRLSVSVAEKEPLVEKVNQPAVWFDGYGDNSINFNLLVWMDIRKASANYVRSHLYYALFDVFKTAGIEIPFPQRDLHIRSGLPLEKIAESIK